MIKKKVKSKTKKIRKCNPYLQSKVEDILNEIDPKNKIEFEFIAEGQCGEIYKFKLLRITKIENVMLFPNEYVLKIFKDGDEISKSEIKWLTQLSDNNLIPKIYIINSDFIIMKYINSKTIWDSIQDNFTLDDYLIILEKIKILLLKWHSLGFAHGDLHQRNILITKNLEVYFIDPNFKLKKDFKRDWYNINKYYNIKK